MDCRSRSPRAARPRPGTARPSASSNKKQGAWRGSVVQRLAGAVGLASGSPFRSHGGCADQAIGCLSSKLCFKRGTRCTHRLSWLRLLAPLALRMLPPL